MRYLIVKKGIICIILMILVQANAQSGAPFKMRPSTSIQKITIDSLFQNSDTLNIFDNTSNIYGLAVDMSVIALSPNFLVRIILTDDDDNQYLVAESYREISEGDTLLFEDYCEETSLLNGITATQLFIYVNNAKVFVDTIDVSIASSSIHNSPSLVQAYRDSVNTLQIQSKVDKINEYNRLHNKLWRADITEVALKPFQIKQRLIGNTLSISTNGIEYYAGGIFHFSNNVSNNQTTSTQFVQAFDWRDAYGKNWLSPIKDQGESAYCAAFASVGALESLASLYYNKLLNLNLSEQEAICCHDGSLHPYIFGAMTENVVSYLVTDGVCDESSYSFIDNDAYDYCISNLVTPQMKVKANSYVSLEEATESQIKYELINGGPLISGYKQIGLGHAMTMIGYGTIGDTIFIRKHMNDSISDIIPVDSIYRGRTFWIFKNSYGEGDVEHKKEPYMNLLFDDLSYMVGPYKLNYPISIIEYDNGIISKEYTSDDIICVDEDLDGYYSWGIGPKPTSCPLDAPDEQDSNDSNPLVGPINQYGIIESLDPNVRDTIDYDDIFDEIMTHCYNHIVIGENGVWEINKTCYFHNGAKLIIKPGASLYITNNAILNDVEIIMYPTSKLYIMDNSKLRIRNGTSFEPPIGAIIYIYCGTIE